MDNHIKTGQKGELLAAEYLRQRKYEIVDTNWRYSRWEVDIIARQADMLIFVEVKTRKSFTYGYPEEAVNAAKQEYLQEAAGAYIEYYAHKGLVRFDIISILITKDPPEIVHIKDAFF